MALADPVEQSRSRAVWIGASPGGGNVGRGTVLVVATVAQHLRAFHLPWARHLRSSGFRVCAAASDVTECGECRGSFDQVVDIPFSRNPFSFKQAFVAINELKELTRRLGATLVHFHTPNAAFWGRLALRTEVARGECRIAYTAHGFHFHSNGGKLRNSFYWTAERVAARYTHALLTINTEDAAAASRFRLAPGGFHDLLPGAGVQCERFDPARFCSPSNREALCSSLRVPRDSALVLMIAELIPRKRHSDSIRALATSSAGQIHLLLAGAGPEERRLRRQARALGLSERVHFLGFRRDIPELLAAADVVVLPSGQEGLPVCVLEAMAMRKPVVVANARGSRDLIRPNCGWVHDIGDTRMLASLLEEVFHCPEEAAERGRKARERVVLNYGWPAVQQKLIGVYHRLGLQVEASQSCQAASENGPSPEHPVPLEQVRRGTGTARNANPRTSAILATA